MATTISLREHSRMRQYARSSRSPRYSQAEPGHMKPRYIPEGSAAPLRSRHETARTCCKRMLPALLRACLRICLQLDVPLAATASVEAAGNGIAPLGLAGCSATVKNAPQLTHHVRDRLTRISVARRAGCCLRKILLRRRPSMIVAAKRPFAVRGLT